MAKTDPQLDVLVLGEHPCTYFAAALLRQKTKLRVVHATIPQEETPERLMLVNPRFFDLHPLLESLRKKLAPTAVYGLRFLADDPETHSEYRSKSAIALVLPYKAVRQAMSRLAEEQGVELLAPKAMRIHHLDEHGLDVTLGSHELQARALILGGRLPIDQQRLLSLPESWEPGIVHRNTFLRFKLAKRLAPSSRPLVPMSLDLGGKLYWAWLLCHGQHGQISVVQPVNGAECSASIDWLRHWGEVLQRHQVLDSTGLPFEEAEHMDVPLGGALAQEGVANRALLIGPAGGFFSASGEDLYPNAWSAVFAADVLKKALRERHLQDALNAYRHRWRTTLGDYLRGPQQNLRFLLPLIYRNPVMAARLAESILTGKSVIR